MTVLKNAFTVDFEDWFQGIELDPATWEACEDRLAVGTLRLLDLLGEANVRATFFILGSAAATAPDLVKEIATKGHEIGSHGYGHEFVYLLGKEAFREDLEKSLEILDRLVSQPVRGYRAPYFSITPGCEWAFDEMAACGLSYDSSVFPVQNYRYGDPLAPRWLHERGSGITELPPSTWRCAGRNIPVAGGAYFRIFPYTLTRFGLLKANSAGHPAVFYIHPWELDPQHPRVPVPRRVAVTHYWNLRATEPRLRRLLADMPFASAAEVIEQVGQFQGPTHLPGPDGSRVGGSGQLTG